MPIEWPDIAAIMMLLQIDNRLPATTADGAVHLLHCRVDLRLEFLITRDPAPARGCELHEHDALSVFWMAFEEPSQRDKSFAQTLGVVDTLDADTKKLC